MYSSTLGLSSRGFPLTTGATIRIQLDKMYALHTVHLSTAIESLNWSGLTATVDLY